MHLLDDLSRSLALPLTYSVLTMVLVVVEILIVIGDILDLVTETVELLLQLVASDTVSVKDSVEVGDDKTLEMEVGSITSILNALNRG